MSVIEEEKPLIDIYDLYQMLKEKNVNFTIKAKEFKEGKRISDNFNKLYEVIGKTKEDQDAIDTILFINKIGN